MADGLSGTAQPATKPPALRHDVPKAGREFFMGRHVGIVVLAACAIASGAHAAVTLEGGHLYATTEQTIWQFAGDGSLVGSLDVSGGELRGIAIGPDDLLYVVHDRYGDSPVVVALTPAGEELRVIPFSAAVWPNIGYGRLCFDHRRRIGYVISGEGLYRFSLDGGGATYLRYGGFDCSVLPDGTILIGAHQGFERVSEDGTLLEAFEELVDAFGAPSGQYVTEVRGIHYSEELDITYATLSIGDRLVALRGVSNVLLQNVYFSYGADISTTRDNEVVVGSRVSAPGILTHDLMLTGNVEGLPGYFVAAYPPSTVIFVESFE